MATTDWFLSADERGNPHTCLDARRGGHSWSAGNDARVLVHGATYFARLTELVDAMSAGDLLLFTDWRGDPDERLGPGARTVSDLFCDAARRGVVVKGLCWRSHLDRFSYSEAENRSLADEVAAAGGEVILDERVRPLGSHHQKLVVLRHPGRPEQDAAFVGGIDLCHTRRDDARHLGDPQTVPMGAVWGPTPAWHDAMLEVRGPAVGDVEATFRERWDDPTSPVVDPISRIEAALHRDDVVADPMPAQLPDPAPRGGLDVQVLRTYPAKRPAYPFAPEGERSIARAYDKAVGRAERLVYLEDQYFWSGEVVSCFARALEEHPGLHLLVVLSTYTTADNLLARASALGSRAQALRDVLDAGGERVGVYGIENHSGTPVYVHTKVCVVDDVWMTLGSDNVNRRSWTHDSELTCAIIDSVADDRAPSTVRADGEPAGAFPRDVRLAFLREHLDREPGDDADLIDPVSAFDAVRDSASRLDAWHAGGRRGDRPPGRLRTYRQPHLSRLARLVGEPIYRYADDPDGRPRRLRGAGRF